jgi:hypothetical protein
MTTWLDVAIVRSRCWVQWWLRERLPWVSRKRLDAAQLTIAHQSRAHTEHANRAWARENKLDMELRALQWVEKDLAKLVDAANTVHFRLGGEQNYAIQITFSTKDLASGWMSEQGLAYLAEMLADDVRQRVRTGRFLRDANQAAKMKELEQCRLPHGLGGSS